VRAYLLVMVVAAVITFLLTGPIRGLAIRAGVVAAVRERDVHVTPIPRLGGIALFLGIAGGLGLAAIVPFTAGTFGQGTTGPLGILLAAAVICAVGVIDDIWGMDPWTKMAGQALAGVVMALLGIRLLAVPINGLILLSGWLLVVLTVGVVIITANAVNFVDGLDGLAAGIVAISGTAFFIYSYLLSREASPGDFSSTATLVTAATVGACLGFLPHNLHPARIFMGDSGALMLGLLLAASTISVTGDTDPKVLQTLTLVPAFVPLLLPVAALLIPVADVVLAVIRRTLAGKSPFSPDSQHLHHRMIQLGHSHGRAVAVLHGWVALLSFSAVATAFVPWHEVAAVSAVVALVLAVITALPSILASRRRHEQRRGEGPGDGAPVQPAPPSAGLDALAHAGRHADGGTYGRN
jgi:UDP-GlcNAc:undecaprenyl-phosphate/decaprenyl-phosphate GlcNAc-1-phosphate transferase